MKKLGLTSVLLSALVLSACGSDSDSNNNALSNKIGLIIYQNSTAGACETESTRQTFYNAGYRDFILKEVSNSSTCATFGKANKNTCKVYTVQNNPNGSVACALGFNNFVGTKSTEDVAIYETYEILESAVN